MRVRGRRIALLIAGALPLLAEDDLSAAIEETPNIAVPQSDTQQQEEKVSLGAADDLHEKPPISLLPLNLLQIEANILTEFHPNELLTAEGLRRHANVVKDELIKDEDLASGDTVKEPPDANESRGLEEAEEPLVDAEDSDDDADANGTESEKEASDEEKSGNELSAPTNVDDSTQNITDSDPNLDATGLEESLTPETTIEASLESGQEDDSAQQDHADSTSNEMSEEAEEEATIPTNEPSEIQQPTAEPQVDQIDEDEEGSISNRVAVDYASKSAGALVLEKSSNFKGTSNLLNGDRDKYAISPCEGKKFVVLSLSEDILVKQVKLVNYELYSSRVKDFQIQISQTMGNWVDLGSYTASPASGVQSFDLREPAWGRYLKFKFTSHYGDEFYCTLTQIMVHGSTMIQGFHEHLQESSEEEEDELNSIRATEAVENTDVVNHKESEPASAHSDANGEDERIEHQTKREDDSQLDGRAHGEEQEVSKAGGASGEMADPAIDLDDEGQSISDDESMVVDNVTYSGQAKPEDLQGEDASDEDKMHTKKLRNFSTALPAASIGLSSDVFTTIIGRLEPLHLKSVPRLSTMHPPSLPDSQQFQSLLAKASDSTKAIKKALTDPALLDNLQLWHEASMDKPFPREAFGSTAIGPREQTLAEKLAAYIETVDTSEKTGTEKKVKDSATTEASLDTAAVEKDDGAEEGKKEATETITVSVAEGDTKDSANPTEEHITTKPSSSVEDGYETLHDTDLALANLLDKLPSIECLKKLDFAAFKEKALASRKGGHGAGGHSAPGNHAEPIFKMLTDQIKALQSNLSIHDQYTKEAVQCYQRVLLDVVVELQTMRFEHEARLSKVEEGLEETKTVRWIFVLYQLVMGLPHWASLLVATFVTTFVSPNAVTRPLEHVQAFLDKYLSEGDHIVLSWTITGCIMILCIVTTLSLCQRIMLAFKTIQNGAASEEKAQAKKDATKENSCRFTVKTADGEVVSVSTNPIIDSSSEVPSHADDFHGTHANVSVRLEDIVSAVSLVETADLSVAPFGTKPVVNADGPFEEDAKSGDEKSWDNTAADVVREHCEDSCGRDESIAPPLLSSPVEVQALEQQIEARFDQAVAEKGETLEKTCNPPDGIESLVLHGALGIEEQLPQSSKGPNQEPGNEPAGDIADAEHLAVCPYDEEGKENVEPDKIRSRQEGIFEPSKKTESPSVDCDDPSSLFARPSSLEEDSNSKQDSTKMEADESCREDETRASSGVRTPDIETESNWAWSGKGPVSPSSVARLSDPDFTKTESRCNIAEPEPNQEHSPSGLLQRENPTQARCAESTASLDGSSSSKASEQKRRSSF